MKTIGIICNATSNLTNEHKAVLKKMWQDFKVEKMVTVSSMNEKYCNFQDQLWTFCDNRNIEFEQFAHTHMGERERAMERSKDKVDCWVVFGTNEVKCNYSKNFVTLLKVGDKPMYQMTGIDFMKNYIDEDFLYNMAKKS